MARTPKALFAAGGTGGHIFPAIAVAQALRRLRPDVEIVFVGSGRRLEARLVPEAGFRFVPIAAAGFPRGLTLRWFPVLGSLALGGVQVLALLLRERPNVIFATGGYVCGPTTAAGALLRIPTVIHESNAVPGLTNRWLGPIVREIHVGFDAAKDYFPTAKTRVSGNPIRPEIVAACASKPQLHATDDPLTLFVLGGSLGSRTLNRAMLQALPFLSDLPVRIVHQTGRDEFEAVCSAYDDLFAAWEACDDAPPNSLAKTRNVTLLPFVEVIGEVYAQADLMLCRSGAMTVSEIALCGVPAIMVPLAHAKTGEQRRNALAIVDAGAGIMIEEHELDGERLARTLRSLLLDRPRLAQMAAQCRTVARPNATQHLADALAAYLHPASPSLSR